MLNALAPAFEQEFLEGSYGYRASRGVMQAVERMLRERDRGFGRMPDADIRDCFDSLEHGVILEGVRRRVRHPLLLRLIELWPEAGAKRTPPPPVEVRPGVWRRSAPAGPAPRRGVPLGAVISLLLCNIVLRRLDLAPERAGRQWVRYADDFVVLTRTRAEAEQAWEEAEAALRGVSLELNPEKTRIASFAEGFTFLGVIFRGDTYSSVYEGKRFEVCGRNLSILWNFVPDPYNRRW